MHASCMFCFACGLAVLFAVSSFSWLLALLVPLLCDRVVSLSAAVPPVRVRPCPRAPCLSSDAPKRVARSFDYRLNKPWDQTFPETKVLITTPHRLAGRMRPRPSQAFTPIRQSMASRNSDH